MIAWLIIAGYTLGWVMAGRWLAVRMLDAEVRRSLRTFPDLYWGPNGAAKAAAEDRLPMIATGFIVAAVWPLSIPVYRAFRAATNRDMFRTQIEREYAERAELDALRRLAREHGLPMPEVKR